MSSTEEVSTLIELIKALNLGTLIPSAFTIALLWKLYGFFNELSEKLTRIETKMDALKDLLPYKIKESLEQRDKTKAKAKPPKHNPSIEKTDWVEVVGIGFGFSDLLVIIITFLQGSITLAHAGFWLMFFVSGVLGILPIIVSEKTISKGKRASLSLLSLVPWVYVVLVLQGIIPQFL